MHAFDHEVALAEQRRRTLGVPVGDFQDAVAKPGRFQRAADQLVGGTQRVRGVGVLVRPLAGAVQRPAALDFQLARRPQANDAAIGPLQALDFVRIQFPDASASCRDETIRLAMYCGQPVALGFPW